MKEANIERITTKAAGFRPNTSIPKMKLAYCYNYGGLGDFVNWTTAIQYAIESSDHTHGIVVTPKFFKDLAQLWLGKYAPRFTVYPCDDMMADASLRDYVYKKTPNMHDNVDALGHNLLQLGFSYYLNKDRIPEGWAHLPLIEGHEASILKFNLPAKYAVITCAATVDVRRLPSATINAISKHCLSLGITPVYLGKAELSERWKYNARTSEEIDFTLGIDLREKTNLVEAACILAKAQFVAGLDNGLLHLAACSEVPIIFAFTTVKPEHRLTPRLKGAKTYVITPDASLECRFCQSNIRDFLGHDFRQCIYKDNACCQMMTPEPFIDGINQIMRDKNETVA